VHNGAPFMVNDDGVAVFVHSQDKVAIGADRDTSNV
jgi:hypothetical protein